MPKGCLGALWHRLTQGACRTLGVAKSAKPILVFGCAYWRISDEECSASGPYATDSMQLGSLLEGLLTLRLTG